MKKTLIWLTIGCLILISVIAPPPTEKTIKGEIRQINGIDQVESGLEVYINNTNTTYNKTTQTYGPPVMPGLYSTTILASEGDVIYIESHNATNWGYVYGIVGKTQLDINVNLNRTRASEAIVLIEIPQNNSNLNTSMDLNVTVDITIVGGNGINCEAILNFSVGGIFGLEEGETYVHDLGNVNRGVTATEVWQIKGLIDGETNISVHAECASDRRIFEDKNTDYVYNLTNLDVSPPIIEIQFPVNNTKSNNPIWIYYNVSEESSLENCTLSLNDLIVNLTNAPNKLFLLNFSNLLSTGENNAEINCSDDSSRFNMGTSGIFNFSLNNFPFISSIFTDNPINLLAANNKTVYCNGTATDLDSFSDIVNVNASLFFKDLNPESNDNRSNKYSNTSCTLLNPSGNNIDFICGFNIEYYANNGTWYCNVSAIDLINSTNSSIDSTLVNDLLALSVTDIIDFRSLEPLQISPIDVASNITNFGNVPMDLSIYGYAMTEGDDLALDCVKGTIGYEFEKFSMFEYQNFNIMQAINNSANAVYVDFNHTQKVYGAAQNSFKSLFWKLQIPFATDGQCNGKVVISAITNS
ncbi:hypothetical protein HN789_06260 [archaeon]|jgi:hypothetical protein|nr:hypothetical protein [archaeon]MBT4022372.1 hypothetical protein [archaeon]MBT4273250.1 hypothetical protein [archaeon]MBT4461307.1 hypothetical protein [archaeon]MBT4858287.1 hypothetical protein [archaeon]